MRKNVSSFTIVSSYIITSSLVFPFFGMLLGYFLTKYLQLYIDGIYLGVIKDVVLLIFFFIGIKYAQNFITDNYIVRKPKLVLYSSLVIFLALILLFFYLFYEKFIIYSVIFHTLIYAIFAFSSIRYFKAKIY